jgi:hypothetical protein
MATMQNSYDPEYFRVIHPLNDVAEQKCSAEGLGHIAMTPAVRISLGRATGILDRDDTNAWLSRAGSGWRFPLHSLTTKSGWGMA